MLEKKSAGRRFNNVFIGSSIINANDHLRTHVAEQRNAGTQIKLGSCPYKCMLGGLPIHLTPSLFYYTCTQELIG